MASQRSKQWQKNGRKLLWAETWQKVECGKKFAVLAVDCTWLVLELSTAGRSVDLCRKAELTLWTSYHFFVIP